MYVILIINVISDAETEGEHIIIYKLENGTEKETLTKEGELAIIIFIESV